MSEIKLPYPEVESGNEKNEKGHKANILATLIQRGLRLMDELFGEFPDNPPTHVTLRRGKIVAMILFKSAGGAEALEDFKGLTTGTKCWHVFFDDAGEPCSSYAGARGNSRLSIMGCCLGYPVAPDRAVTAEEMEEHLRED